MSYVVKAVGEAGGIGIVCCANAEELRQAIDLMIEENISKFVVTKITARSSDG